MMEMACIFVLERWPYDTTIGYEDIYLTGPYYSEFVYYVPG